LHYLQWCVDEQNMLFSSILPIQPKK
jgi:hypothetical protein